MRYRVASSAFAGRPMGGIDVRMRKPLAHADLGEGRARNLTKRLSTFVWETRMGNSPLSDGSSASACGTIETSPSPS